MILFPNAKINLGLLVTGERPDGYHDLSTVMLPVGWCDIMEIIAADGDGITFHCEDDFGGCGPENNLVVKALRALEDYIGRSLPPMEIYLKKIIPMGAGLGGGSADASFAIRGVNELFGLGLDNAAMAQVALKVGADCPFFIYNRPALATGVGEILEPVDISVIAGCGLLIAKPRSEAVSTREAYAGVTIGAPVPGKSPASELTNAVGTWRHSPLMVNGFEDTIFPLRPEIRAVKERMYGAGAMFASMSGSGAAVYGIFPDAKMAEEARGGFGDCEVFAGVL